MKKIINLIIISIFINTSLYSEEINSVLKIENKKPFYIGSGLNIQTNNKNNVIDNLSVTAGYNFNKYIALETRYMRNIVSNNIFVDDISLFLKPQVNIYNINFYSLLGYGKLKLDDDLYKSNTYDFKWGVGFEYNLKEYADIPVNVFIDYTDITSGEEKDFNLKEKDINTINIGFTYKF